MNGLGHQEKKMSKSAKTAAKKKRFEQKKARRAAMQATYQKYAEQGKNTKSKRNRSKNAGSIVRTTSHPDGQCGNPACTKCFGYTFSRLFFENGIPVGMPQKMYIKWKEQKNVRALQG